MAHGVQTSGEAKELTLGPKEAYPKTVIRNVIRSHININA